MRHLPPLPIFFSFSCSFWQNSWQTRMHSSRMRTARSSSRHGGCGPGPDPPQLPLGCRPGLDPLNFPLGCGPGPDPPQLPLGCGPGPDPPKFPLWVWA